MFKRKLQEGLLPFWYFLPVLLFAWLAYEQRWMSDDGFINLRIVENILEGHGPVFNPGERVEAFTSPLWIAVLTVFGVLGLRLEYVAVYGGILLSLCGLIFALLSVLELTRDKSEQRLTDQIRERVWVPLGVLIFIALPPTWDFASSGLETGLSMAWLGWSHWLLVRFVKQEEPPRLRRLLGLSMVCGLGPLIRPDLALFSAAFVVVLWVGVHLRSPEGRRWRLWLWVFLGWGALPVLYQLFRMGYYAALVPNTALAKEAFGSRWAQGWLFFVDFFGTYWMAIPLAIVAVFWVQGARSLVADRKWLRLSLLIAPGIAGLAGCLYVIKVGGGFMHGRLFLHGFFGLLLPVSAAPMMISETGSASPRRLVAAALLVVWAMFCGRELRMDQAYILGHNGIINERLYFTRTSSRPNPILAEHHTKFFVTSAAALERARSCRADESCHSLLLLDGNAAEFGGEPSELEYVLAPGKTDDGVVLVIARTAIGTRGYVMGSWIHVVDRQGLSDPIAGRLYLKERTRPGHEKRLPNAFLIGRYTEASPGEDPQISAARRALGCGTLRELDRAIREPLSPSLFISNIGNSFSFHDLRIPIDPFEAEAKFCP